MKNETITIWRAWTTLKKNGEGFATIGKYSAHIASAVIFIAELDEEELAAAEPGYTHKICIPTILIGSAYQTCGDSILCKSLGHAHHVMASKGPLNRAIKAGWFENAEQAAKEAYNQLVARSGQ